MQGNVNTYSSGLPVTPSDVTPISCRGIYVGGTGNIAVNPFPAGNAGATVTYTAPVLGQVLPIELDQGRIMAATTATLLVAVA